MSVNDEVVTISGKSRDILEAAIDAASLEIQERYCKMELSRKIEIDPAPENEHLGLATEFTIKIRFS